MPRFLDDSEFLALEEARKVRRLNKQELDELQYRKELYRVDGLGPQKYLQCEGRVALFIFVLISVLVGLVGVFFGVKNGWQLPEPFTLVLVLWLVLVPPLWFIGRRFKLVHWDYKKFLLYKASGEWPQSVGQLISQRTEFVWVPVVALVGLFAVIVGPILLGTVWIRDAFYSMSSHQERMFRQPFDKFFEVIQMLIVIGGLIFMWFGMAALYRFYKASRKK
jgi:hypothetical protein